MKLHYVLAILLFISQVVFVQAQEQITVKEAAEITYQAKETVKAYQSLLNFVAFAENAPNELKEAIENSYSPSRNQIFYSKDAVIEDDIDPENQLGHTKDLPADKYLNTLDILYEKDIDPTITLSNFQVSHLKKKDYLYIKVFFECQFSRKDRKKQLSYPVRQRIALLRAEKRGNRWYTFISGIRFFDPSLPIESTDNDILILSDIAIAADTTQLSASGNTEAVASSDRLELAIKEYEALQEESKKKLEEEFKQAITHANQLYANQEFEEAETAYKKARELNPFNTVPLVQLIRVKKELSIRTYESYMAQAERAKKERRYEVAMDFYQKAVQKKPQATDIITRELQPLSQRVNDISSVRNRIEAGKIADAIEECDRKIKEKRKVIADYPEFFLLRGKAYLLSSDRKAKERALEDFNKAIEIDAYYQEARLIRADYLEKNGNAIGAITDYDVALANIPLGRETHSERVAIITKKVLLKKNTSNLKGAIEEYEKLIRETDQLGLTQNAEVFYEKGLLEFKKAATEQSTTEYQNADKSFSKAISLNSTLLLAYFQRGLVRFDLEKYREAAKDFFESEKLGLDSVSRKSIEWKSKTLYDGGVKALEEGQLDKAEKFFRNAIVIRPKNSLAWFKKGEVLFSRQEFETAIDHYNTAIGFTSVFPEVYYKKGLALYRLSRYNEAIQCFDQAIKQNKNYIEAYKGAGDSYQKLTNFKIAFSFYQNAITILQPDLKKAQKADNKNLVTKLKSQLAEVYHGVGQCHYNTKAYPDAIKAFDKAIEYVPDFSDAYYYRGITFLAQNNLKDAVKNISKALEYFPENPSYRYAIANAYYLKKEYGEAIKNYTTVLRIDSINTLKDTKHRRGLSFVMAQNYEKALKDFSEYNASVENGKETVFYTDYGFLYLQMKQDSLATMQFNKALLHTSEFPEALYGLACVYDTRNNTNDAMLYVEKALLSKQLNKSFVVYNEEFFLKNLRNNKVLAKRYSALKKKNLLSSPN
ncbi:tetratricopeptide repeat protein [Cytophagaceae bacterium DM2B3-1]|uniref:Tetratricopeptide repeat protein n=1 Tax=Xanthocytophaga flava TaxID=3048013 RepID=A0ABT7CTD3_9BACT|nr:tetratricopeptide repeat protein [Xanthocytophaga flavus]MDJ1472176.1 tetratricopeptide repeat protein [Xanthocytophaga flavus]MDJ1496960.1 tetratricopeptide repeat protein [Xanthocytophaga flavus]